MEKFIKKYFGYFEIENSYIDETLRDACLEEIMKNDGKVPSWMYVILCEDDVDSYLDEPFLKRNSHKLTKTDLDILFELEELGYGTDDEDMFYYNSKFVYAEFIKDYDFNRIISVINESKMAQFLFIDLMLTKYGWKFNNFDEMIQSYNGNHKGLISQMLDLLTYESSFETLLIENSDRLSHHLKAEIIELHNKTDNFIIHLITSLILGYKSLNSKFKSYSITLDNKIYYYSYFRIQSVKIFNDTKMLMQEMPNFIWSKIDIEHKIIDELNILQELLFDDKYIYSHQLTSYIPKEIMNNNEDIIRLVSQDEKILTHINQINPMTQSTLSKIRKIFLEDLKLDWKEFDKLTAPEPKEIV